MEPQANPFAVAAAQREQNTIAIATTRAAQEVQAAMVIAKKYPRDQVQAYDRIMVACRRKNLAEVAIYTYPRGDTRVEGPSIRLAEALAQSWGNLDFGIVELEQREGESSMMAFAWDLETNCRQTKVFTVKHERHTKKGTTMLTDPRDVYEVTANQGARRLRACILGVIPGDVVEAAVDECNKTLSSNEKSEPLIDRVRKMAHAFTAMGVTIPMIEKRLNHKLDATNEAEVVGLRKIYSAIRDGMASRESYFEPVTIDVESTPGPKIESRDDAQMKRRQEHHLREKAAPAVETGTVDPDAQDFAPVTNSEDGSPPEPEPEPTAEPVEPLTIGAANAESYLNAIRHGLKARGLPEDWLVDWCRKQGMAKPTQKLADLSTVKLLQIVEKWSTIVTNLTPPEPS